MNSFVLKFGVVFLFFTAIAICSWAQTSRFIYLQTENSEGFYVKLDKKVLNSSPLGYLIIPKLSENTYPITIGFHDAGLPEISLSVKIRDVNMGFLLKNTGDRGWTLLNLQTMQPLAVKKEYLSGREEKGGPAIDEFSRILAEVVDEPSIAWAPAKTEKAALVQQVTKTEENKIPVTPQMDSIQGKKPAVPVDIIITNANCKKSATQKDYLKLRKQMAGEASEKNMIKAANKQFLNSCYTTEQVKNLGVLFINEEEKYKFFVAAYPYISDSNNFGSLKDQLTDNYYKARLEAMVGH